MTTPVPRESVSVRRKRNSRDFYEALATQRDRWAHRNAYFHEEDHRYMRFLVPEGLRVLDLGSGTGDLLAALRPSHGVGVDVSERMVGIARQKHPRLEFREGDAEDEQTLRQIDGLFDVIVLSDLIGSLEDCQQAFERLHHFSTADTRVVVVYYSPFWGPLLRLAGRLGLKMPEPEQNWLSTEDIEALLRLADFEVVNREWRLLLPLRLFGLGRLVNRFLANLPVIRRLCLRNYIVARSMRMPRATPVSVSIVIPCRNERGNVEAAVRRIPRFCDDIEILFIEGHSRDGTLEEIQRVAAAYPDHDIRILQQDGIGKADAVRKGFEHARGDVLMILDADLTTPPESLPKFYEALVCSKGEFINGTRLVYPIEREAMRFLNLVANHVFSTVFSWLLNQRITDTLCGTKVLSARHYRAIATGRSYFGNFDPFGDFDLIFGAAKQNLKIVEIPVRYASRRYGETQISRFRHGWMLARMVLFAYRKMKAL
jgi:SAM-dependent methyltransferase